MLSVDSATFRTTASAGLNFRREQVKGHDFVDGNRICCFDAHGAISPSFTLLPAHILSLMLHAVDLCVLGLHIGKGPVQTTLGAFAVGGSLWDPCQGNTNTW